jgi:metallo-beta-lactamase family protein
MLGDARHDVLFCGYQAAGTPGLDIQAYGSKSGGYVQLDGQRFDIRAGIHTLRGFSAHADQKDLLNFVGRIPQPPRQVCIVHGDDKVKATLAQCIRGFKKNIEVVIP